jgi:hypothetical protein
MLDVSYTELQIHLVLDRARWCRDNALGCILKSISNLLDTWYFSYFRQSPNGYTRTVCFQILLNLSLSNQISYDIVR